MADLYMMQLGKERMHQILMLMVSWTDRICICKFITWLHAYRQKLHDNAYVAVSLCCLSVCLSVCRCMMAHTVTTELACHRSSSCKLV